MSILSPKAREMKMLAEMCSSEVITAYFVEIAAMRGGRGVGRPGAPTPVRERSCGNVGRAI